MGVGPDTHQVIETVRIDAVVTSTTVESGDATTEHHRPSCASRTASAPAVTTSPKTRFRERHRRLGDLVAAAIAITDNATVYDNSAIRGPRIVAQFSGGLLVGTRNWPHWAPTALTCR